MPEYQFTDEAPAFFHYLGKKPPKQPACQCPRRLKVIKWLADFAAEDNK